VNKYGFIESPYRRVKDSRPWTKVVYISAMESKYTIAGQHRPEGRHDVDELVRAFSGESQLLIRADVDYDGRVAEAGRFGRRRLIPFWKRAAPAH
jgi:DNA-directed RNA polymerase subunit beta